MQEEPMRVRDHNDLVEEAYERVAPQLWRSLVAFSGDREIATDAVAEAFAQVLRRGAEVRDVERWVWKVGYRVAAGELKRRGRDVEAPGPAAYELPHDAIAVAEILGRLSPKRRAAIVLHYLADIPNAEIARILGVTSATVRVHLYQGRKQLKQLMEESDA
jgi:RNA polymerase sigma-70 factor (ECF subfamily)